MIPIDPFEYTFGLPNIGGRPRFVLMMLEATAHGITGYKSIGEIADRVGCSPTSVRKALNHLHAVNAIGVLQTAGQITAIFGAHRVTLDAPSAVVDDPWQIIRAKVFAQKGSQCVYCGNDASQVDHVIPRSRGGSGEVANLVPACARCNNAKGDKTPEEWRPA
jgi:5-methylcytosine-specific restriction endonuclease McrA